MSDTKGGDLPGARTADVAWIVLDRKDAKVNVMDAVFAKELAEVVKSVAEAVADEGSDVQAVCVTSAKAEGFSPGLDTALLYNQTSLSQATEFLRSLFTTFDLLANLPIPSVAMLHGAVLGAGYELALACTLRMCAQKSVLGLPEVKSGLIPACGALIRLPQLVGLKNAASLIVNGRTVRTGVAYEERLIDMVMDSRTGRGAEVEMDRLIWDVVTRSPTIQLRRGCTKRESWLQNTMLGRFWLRLIHEAQQVSNPAPRVALDTLFHCCDMKIAQAVAHSVKAAASQVVSSHAKTLMKQKRDIGDIQQLTRRPGAVPKEQRSILAVGPVADVAALVSTALRNGRFCILAALSARDRVAVVDAMEATIDSEELDLLLPRLQKYDTFLNGGVPSASGYGVVAVVWNPSSYDGTLAEYTKAVSTEFLAPLDLPEAESSSKWLWLRSSQEACVPTHHAPCVRVDFHVVGQSTTADVRLIGKGWEEDAATHLAVLKLTALGCLVLVSKGGVVDGLVSCAHGAAAAAGASPAMLEENLHLGEGVVGRMMASQRLALTSLPQATAAGEAKTERFLVLLCEALLKLVEEKEAEGDTWVTVSVVDSLFVTALGWPSYVAGPFTLFDERYVWSEIG